MNENEKKINSIADNAPSTKGRPSKYTEELFQEICDRLEEGENLRKICRDEHMPSARAVYRWMEKDKEDGDKLELSSLFARARSIGYDAIAEECLSIADDSTNDFLLNKNGDEVLNTEHVQRSKLRIETRLKLLAKWDPKRYGDKVDHTSSDGSMTPKITINRTVVSGGAKDE